eukprot:scaffold6.g2564.t1
MMRRQLLQLSQQLASAGAAAGGVAASTSGRAAAEWGAPPALRWLASGAGGSAAAAAAAAAARGDAPVSASRRLRQLVRNYKQLSKLRLSGLVVATAAAGYAAGSREAIDWRGLGWTSLGTWMASSSANAFNQIYEVVNDGRMRRTAARPLPSGRMGRAHALAFAVAVGAGGVWLLAEKTNGLTAALGAGNVLLYAAVYTPLKQLSIANTWVGAVVGAVPPLMGWAAAAGGLDAGAAILAAGLYFWQMPHFMALAWMCRADYAAGGYRMLSLVDTTGRRAAACALRNCAYLFPLGLLATWLGVTSPYFAYESAFITGGMLLTAAKFYSSPSTASARLLFRASLLHLPLFMAAFLAHRLPNTSDAKLELLWHNVRLLGLGEPVAHGPSAAGELAAHRPCQAMPFLPPLPFLPLPHLPFSCPSKAACLSAEEGEEEGGAAAEAAADAAPRCEQ